MFQTDVKKMISLYISPRRPSVPFVTNTPKKLSAIQNNSMSNFKQPSTCYSANRPSLRLGVRESSAARNLS